VEEDWKPGEIFSHSGRSESEDPESRNVVPVKAARADLPLRTSFDALSFAQDRQFGPLEAASQRKTLSW